MTLIDSAGNKNNLSIVMRNTEEDTKICNRGHKKTKDHNKSDMIHF